MHTFPLSTSHYLTWLRLTAFSGRLVLLAGLLAAASASAQVNRYTFSQSTSPYVPLGNGSTIIASGATTPILLGQAFQLPAGTIPFPFRFNDIPYTGFYAAYSGYLTFGAARPITDSIGRRTPPWWYNPISEPTPYDGAIAPLATGFIGRTFQNNYGELRHQTLGTAPSRVFVVQWKDMGDNNSSGYYNFQVRLHETTNAIDFAYGACLAQADGKAQVGLRGSTNNDFINRKGFWNNTVAGTVKADSVLLRVGNVPASGLVYTYTPGAPLPCAQPFSLSADQLTPTTARLNWRVAGGTGPFTVRYGPVGFNPATPGAGFTATVAAGAANTTITGLAVFTTYDFYITQNCGGTAGDSPISNPKGSFRTTLANDDPAVAVNLPIGATCVPVAGTTLGATTTPVNGYAPQAGGPGCNIRVSSHDVWYKFTTASTPASQTVRLITTGSGAQEIKLFSSAGGAAGPFTTLACQIFASGNAPTLTYGGLTANTTYYLLVAGNTRDAAFTICATFPPGCGDPLNVAVGSITATTAQLNFTASSGSPVGYTVTLTPLGGAATTVPATAPPVALTNLLPGTAYTLTLVANCGAAGQSATITRTFTTLPANDEPAGAIALPLNPTCQPTAGSVTGASVSAAAPTPAVCSGNLPTGDVWYSFTTAATGPASTAVRLELTAADGFVVVVYSSTGGAAGPFVLENCTSTPVAATSGLDLDALLPSTTYYVQIWSRRNVADRTFSICARYPIACPEPATLAVGNITSTSAVVSWLVNGLGIPPVGFVLTYTPQGGATTTLTPTGSPVTLSSLLPGTVYTVAVQANCGSVNGFSTAVTTTFRTPGPPANDLCSGAIALGCGQTIPGTTIAATRTGEPTTVCSGNQPGAAGVWYVWQQPTGQTVTLRTCLPATPNPPFMPTQLFVFAGSCTGLTCLTSSDRDPACAIGGLAGVTFAAQAGQPYYVLVTNPFGFTNNFILTTTCGPLATQAPAALAAQVSVFPNPARQSATLALPAGLLAQPASLTLVNALGQVVQTQAVPAAATATRLPLDLRGLPAGVYSVRLSTDQGPVTKRLVVE